MKTLATIVRDKRLKKHLSQTKLAELINRSPQLICDIEAGRKKPSRDTIIRIAKILELSLDKIFLQ